MILSGALNIDTWTEKVLGESQARSRAVKGSLGNECWATHLATILTVGWILTNSHFVTNDSHTQVSLVSKALQNNHLDCVYSLYEKYCWIQHCEI